MTNLTAMCHLYPVPTLKTQSGWVWCLWHSWYLGLVGNLVVLDEHIRSTSSATGYMECVPRETSSIPNVSRVRRGEPNLATETWKSGCKLMCFWWRTSAERKFKALTEMIICWALNITQVSIITISSHISFFTSLLNKYVVGSQTNSLQIRQIQNKYSRNFSVSRKVIW